MNPFARIPCLMAAVFAFSGCSFLNLPSSDEGVENGQGSTAKALNITGSAPGQAGNSPPGRSHNASVGLANNKWTYVYLG